jgi:hypothetical protein
MDGGLLFEGGSMLVNSSGSSAGFELMSTGSSALLKIESHNTSRATLRLGSGSDLFDLSASASALSFSTSNGTWLALAPSSGAASVSKSLAVSAVGQAASLNVASPNGAATLAVSSGTAQAAVTLSAPAGQPAFLRLNENQSHSWDIRNNATTNAMEIAIATTTATAATSTWLRIKENGATFFTNDLSSVGNLVVGGDQVSGARRASIISSNSNASLHVRGSTYAVASITSNAGSLDVDMSLTAARGRKAAIVLTEGTDAFNLEVKDSTNTFVIRGSSEDWFTIHNSTGNTIVRNALTVKNSALKVDGTSGWVGVGKTSPEAPLHVYGTSGCKVESNFSTAAFQVLSYHENVLHNVMLSVDTQNSRVGIGTATPTETMHVYGGSMKIEDYFPQHGDINVGDGAVHLAYLSHDAAERLGGPKYYCLKVGTGAPTGQATGGNCSAPCGGKSPQPACSSADCGAGGWCTNNGLHNHYFVVSEVDVYLPDVREGNDNNRMFFILFKKTGAETERFVVGTGDGESGTHYNPASNDYMTVNQYPAPTTKLRVEFGSYNYQYVTCTFSGSMWRCYTWHGQ